MELLQEPSALVVIMVIILLVVLLLVILDHRKTVQVSDKLDKTNIKLDFFQKDMTKEIKKQTITVQTIMKKVDQLHSCK